MDKGQSVRRSLERVESIKNLLEHDHGVGMVAQGNNYVDQKANYTQDDEEDDGEVKVGDVADAFDRSQFVNSDCLANEKIVLNEVTTKPHTVFDTKTLVLAPMDSSRNS